MLIEIFVAPDGCPACGKAERLVKDVAKDYAGVEVREIHILDAIERVAGYGVFTTPFIVMDGKLEFVGVPRESDFRSRIVERTSAGT